MNKTPEQRSEIRQSETQQSTKDKERQVTMTGTTFNKMTTTKPFQVKTKDPIEFEELSQQLQMAENNGS